MPWPATAAACSRRDDEINEVLHQLDPILPRVARRFLVIVGPSGSGKSSLLHAGSLPRLDRMPDRWLVLPPLRLLLTVDPGLGDVRRYPPGTHAGIVVLCPADQSAATVRAVVVAAARKLLTLVYYGLRDEIHCLAARAA